MIPSDCPVKNEMWDVFIFKGPNHTSVAINFIEYPIF